jgi:hypothetical protein
MDYTSIDGFVAKLVSACFVWHSVFISGKRVSTVVFCYFLFVRRNQSCSFFYLLLYHYIGFISYQHLTTTMHKKHRTIMIACKIRAIIEEFF